MAVFRIERTRDYTVMSNHHLRNHELSLKAKGLLSMMLSLPDDWNYTTRGLAKICKEGVDAIGGALRELETAGYIVRHQLRDRQGRISDTEYPKKNGKVGKVLFYNNGFRRDTKVESGNPDVIARVFENYGRNSLIKRLKASQCEWCGAENVPIEIHHVRKLKDLSGRKQWEIAMIGRKRKTMALCIDCHDKLHAGKLD